MPMRLANIDPHLILTLYNRKCQYGCGNLILIGRLFSEAKVSRPHRHLNDMGLVSAILLYILDTPLQKVASLSRKGGSLMLVNFTFF